MASYRIEFTRSAKRDLRQFDRSILTRVMAAIDDLLEAPRPASVKKLIGSEHTTRWSAPGSSSLES